MGRGRGQGVAGRAVAPMAIPRADSRLTEEQQRLANALIRDATSTFYANPNYVAPVFDADRPLNEVERALLARWIERFSTDAALLPRDWSRSNDPHDYDLGRVANAPMRRHVALNTALAQAIGGVSERTRKRIYSLEERAGRTYNNSRSKRLRDRKKGLVDETRQRADGFEELRQAHVYTALAEQLGPWTQRPNPHLFGRAVARAFDEGGRRALTESYQEGFDNVPMLLGMRQDGPGAKAFAKARARPLLPDSDPREILPPGELYLMMRAIEVDRVDADALMSEYVAMRGRGQESTNAMTSAIAQLATDQDMRVEVSRVDEYKARIRVAMPPPARAVTYQERINYSEYGGNFQTVKIKPTGDKDYDAWLRDLTDARDDRGQPRYKDVDADDGNQVQMLVAGGLMREAVLTRGEQEDPYSEVHITADSRTVDDIALRRSLDLLKQEAADHNSAVAEARIADLLAKREAAIVAIEQSPKTRHQVAADLEQRHPAPRVIDANALIELLTS